jgi:hypothetical protein
MSQTSAQLISSGIVAPATLSTGAPGWDSSGNLSFNSGYGSSAVAYACRAWVNFNGTTATPSTIRGSGNVSSVTKNGTGDYTITFTTAMVDANYSFGAICSSTSGASGYVARINNTAHVAAGSLRVTIVDPTVAAADAAIVGLTVIR